MLIKINSHLQHFNRVSEVIKTRPGFYVAKTIFGDVEIFGGKKAGGSRNEWFVEGASIGCVGWLDANGLVDALKLIDNA